jgi:hypothetical protein
MQAWETQSKVRTPSESAASQDSIQDCMRLLGRTTPRKQRQWRIGRRGSETWRSVKNVEKVAEKLYKIFAKKLHKMLCFRVMYVESVRKVTCLGLRWNFHL